MNLNWVQNKNKTGILRFLLILFLSFSFLTKCTNGKTEEILREPGDIPQWTVGQWAEYEIHKGSEEYTIKYTIVDREYDEENFFWIESIVVTENDSFLWQALVPEYFNGTPKELVIVDLTQRDWEALAIPLGQSCRTIFMLGNFNPENLKKLGFETENITMPAGEFYSLHCRFTIETKPVDVWISSKVPILGIVRWESQDELRTVKDYGENGRSILPDDIVRRQISPADFSKHVFKENLISFYQENIPDTDSLISDSIE